MRAFLDTSVVLAVLDPEDRGHGRSVEALRAARSKGDVVTHNYLVVEAVALAHKRLGAEAARALVEDFFPALEVVFVDEELHAETVSRFVGSERGRFSFVDHASFAFMRREGITRALTLDRDFAREGFEVFP